MTDATNDWKNKSFMEKAAPVLRVHAAEYVASAASHTKLVGQVFDKAGFLIPKVGPVLGKAIGVLCDYASRSLDWTANQVRGGYQIEGLPQAMQYLPSMWRAMGRGSERLVNFLTPEHINDGVQTYGRISDALKTLKPDLRLPVLAPAVT